jgi:energy-coupling factor transporter ATP-binding protein EcfA2
MRGTSDLTEVSFTGDELRNLAIPSVALKFGRVTVALGANGSGKSSLLSALRSFHAHELAPGATLVLIEGGRSIQLPSDLAVTGENFQTKGRQEAAASSHAQKLQGRLTDRVSEAASDGG